MSTVCVKGNTHSIPIFCGPPGGGGPNIHMVDYVNYMINYTVTGVYISTLGGLWSISCGQYLDPTLGKFCPIYGPHLVTNLFTTIAREIISMFDSV